MVIGDDGFSNGFFGGIPPVFIFFFVLIFVLVIGTIIFALVRGIGTWASNNAANVETQNCKVVSKRTEVRGDHDNFRANTNYYVTFELYNGTRVELPVSGPDFGVMVEGDYGTVTYQGTRFKQFTRQITG
ncbi:DUF2500 domain-containing protein [Paenibacillus protaetiae]|uniref:DUF2500 domain-containing protein n=1 Tax=Paenibacillus protaetiae TaxID=2509456 RepID=A0A4P6ETW7_9BACL|nr:DUF2500 domain-containing protein [Paenibacillus protaetiae]QAY65513.1 DUF2500 domain-containing protein [Paenibacillus protaetiae]